MKYLKEFNTENEAILEQVRIFNEIKKLREERRNIKDSYIQVIR